MEIKWNKYSDVDQGFMFAGLFCVLIFYLCFFIKFPLVVGVISLVVGGFAGLVWIGSHLEID